MHLQQQLTTNVGVDVGYRHYHQLHQIALSAANTHTLALCRHNRSFRLKRVSLLQFGSRRFAGTVPNQLKMAAAVQLLHLEWSSAVVGVSGVCCDCLL